MHQTIKRRVIMKKMFTLMLLVAIVISFATQSKLYALSSADTLVIYASGLSIDKIIGKDTTSTGAQNHKAYKLVSRDTTYLFDGTITLKSSVAIIGVPDPSTGRLPCIQPDVLGDGSIPGVLFTFTGNNNKFLLKNLYLLGLALNNTVNTQAGQAVQISGDNISFTSSNVVYEEWAQFAIGYAGNLDKFMLTNCKIRNLTLQPNQWYVGELLRNENYLGAFKTDSIVIKYCTLLCVSGYATAATGGMVNYYEFSHNNVIYTFKNPFFLDRMTNAKFDNNIFYGAFAGGQNKTEFAGWDSFTANTGPSIITMGPLDSTTASILLGHSSTGAGDPAAELLRKVEVKNNVYTWPNALTTFWKAWNDTARVDSIYTPQFMNNVTANMFATPAKWPGFVSSGNQNVNPGFGPSIDNVLNPGGTSANDVGLLKWFAAVRAGTGTTQLYGYKMNQVSSSGNWIPTWPLPELADMQYSNTSLKTGATDGKPVGDPGWFTGGFTTGVAKIQSQIPAKFALYQSYPNPFNPTTNISFSLPEPGNVSLKIYDVMGREVRDVVANEYKSQGTYKYTVNMDNVASGVYFYTLKQNSNIQTMKMILLK
jgi:hypothetical protein